MHLGILAISDIGYRNLANLITVSSRNFWFKPRLDMADFAEMSEQGLLDGLVVMSGCWFGLIPTFMRDQPKAVANLLTSLDMWFGGGVYVEIQNHRIDRDGQSDAAMSRRLMGVANDLGLPVVITQDSHYTLPSHQKDHEFLKRLSSWSKEADDAVFPGDGYHMVDTDWMIDHHPPDIFAAGMEGLADLASRAKVVIPELDTFHLAVPDVSITGWPIQDLTTRCTRKLASLIEDGTLPRSKMKAYRERLGVELEVIDFTGFAGYLLFTAKVTDMMTKAGIMFLTRGSAGGSLLCWLLGITTHDPIVWGMLFERFMVKDQGSPPDIDLDVDDTRREEVVDWLASNYPTFHIANWSRFGLSDSDSTTELTGSVLVQWRQMLRRTGKDKAALPTQQEIAAMRSLVEHRSYTNAGVHAAGIVVPPDEHAAAAVPLMHSNRGLISSFDKHDVEAMGLLKLDVLGSTTLSALRILEELTGVHPRNVPLDDKDVYTAIRRQPVDGLFQLSGGATQWGLRQLKPRTIHDIIAAQALFRPAVMNSGSTEKFLSRRSRYESVPEYHPIIAGITKSTYGIMLYQEQIITLLRQLGMTPEQIDTAKKAVKASNKDVDDAQQKMKQTVESIRDLTEKAGFSADDTAYVVDALLGYAAYGFNFSHAVAYGVQSYITAWYKTHFKTAFWTAQLIAHSDSKKRLINMSAARAENVVFVRPHVNVSHTDFSWDETLDAIRKGVESISGVGGKASADLAAHAPYTSLDDLARRVNRRIVTGSKALGEGQDPELCGGVIAALSKAGALLGLGREQESIFPPAKKPRTRRVKKETGEH